MLKTQETIIHRKSARTGLKLALIGVLVILLVGGEVHAADYLKGGQDWGANCTAETMKRQSPINLEDFKGACDNTIHLDLTLTPKATNYSAITIKDPGLLAIQADNNSTIGYMYATDLEGKIFGYNAQRVIAHAPSEHSIDGVNFDLELQIEMTIIPNQFQNVTRDRAVVSLLFAKNEKASKFVILDLFMAPESIEQDLSKVLGQILPQPFVYFAYEGSSTVPDCKENVMWYIVQNSIPIEESQLLAFNNKLKNDISFAGGNGNNRVKQDLNNRLVKKGGVECEEQFIYFFSFVLLYAFINYFIFKLL